MKHLLKTALLTFALAAPLCGDNTQPIVRLQVEGIINPVVATYVVEGIKKAEEMNAAAILIELDTPGGLLDATRTMISGIVNTERPVVVYVSPRGSRATSAGVFITMAADVAAMAPETHIGAAHPVTVGGGETFRFKNKKSTGTDEPEPANVMEEKMVSDSAAYIRALADDRGRNADWAERAVRESVSLTAKEALAQNVIEIIADSRDNLLAQLEGRKITKNKKTYTLELKGRAIEDIKLSGTRKILHMLAHPNVAYILMTVGVYGLIYELAAPGIGLGGVVGIVCLLLAFFSLQVLPINMVGIALIALGAALIVAELFTPTHGVLAVGGMIAFTVGSFIMIDSTPAFTAPRVSLMLILPSVLVTGGFFFFVFKKLAGVRRAKPKVGAESLIGQTGEVKERIAPEGLVFANGELWSARADEIIEVGTTVVIKRIDGNFLIVKKN